jgi:hypothetical protein
MNAKTAKRADTTAQNSFQRRLFMRSKPIFSGAPCPILAGCAIAVLLAGCGGGSSSGPAPAPAPAAVTVDVPVKVIDGALQNAKVCIDVDASGTCDPAEPSGITDADGKAILKVPTAEAGKHAVVAEVGADAIDADTGAVSVPFLMKAPADRPGLISPLTTMVQTHIQRAGGSSADAEAFVKNRAGIATSPFEDYTAAGADPTGLGATLARLIVVTAQRQATALASIVGQVDRSGATISPADVNAASNDAVLNALAAVGDAAKDPAMQPAASREAAIQERAQQLVATETGLTAANAPTAIGLHRLYAAEAAPDPGGATGTLRALSYTDANNWFYRAGLATAADNEPDAAGLRRYYDLRVQNTNGTIASWGYGGTPARAGDLHWSGSAWTGCPIGTRHTTSSRDAQGISQYNYCDSVETGASRRAEVDIADRTLTSVVSEIRTLPGGDSGVAFANFGPGDLAALGTATFPAGSKLFYQSSTPVSSAYSYDVQGPLNLAVAEIAAGGDTRNNPAVPCGAILPTTPPSEYRTLTTTLEEMILLSKGTPCIFNQQVTPTGSSLPVHESWGFATVNVGTIANGVAQPPGTGGYYSTTAGIRVAFTGASSVTYYQCYLRASDESSRNCTAIGTGTYSIVAVGDARVLALTTPPSQAASLTYERIFVEREGKVYFGYVNKIRSTETARLNLPAANALLNQLGIASLVPQ